MMKTRQHIGSFWSTHARHQHNKMRCQLCRTHRGRSRRAVNCCEVDQVKHDQDEVCPFATIAIVRWFAYSGDALSWPRVACDTLRRVDPEPRSEWDIAQGISRRQDQLGWVWPAI